MNGIRAKKYLLPTNYQTLPGTREIIEKKHNPGLHRVYTLVGKTRNLSGQIQGAIGTNWKGIKHRLRIGEELEKATHGMPNTELTSQIGR